MDSQVHSDRLDLIALAWLWCQQGKAVKAAKLETAIKPIVPTGTAKTLAEASLNRSVQTGSAEEIPAKKGKGDFRITPAGQQRVREALKRDALPAGKTPFKALLEFSFAAIAENLAIPGSDKKTQKDFFDLLKIAICARHFALDVPLDQGPAAAKLHLLKLALSRANAVPPEKIHLKKVPTDSELLALVVGPLLSEPDTAAAKLEKLIVSKASAILNVTKPAQIKPGVVRRWLSQPAIVAESTAIPAETPAALDLKTFANHVVEAAKEVSRTNPRAVSSLGDKVLVHFVWQAYERWFAPMRLEAFKQHLSDANGDLLVLVREDMIPEDRRQEFLESEVRRGASCYHYIRIGSLGVQHGGI
jgi:hypothetical protein